MASSAPNSNPALSRNQRRALLYIEVSKEVRERLKIVSGGQYRSIPGVVRMLIDRYLAEQAQAAHSHVGEALSEER